MADVCAHPSCTEAVHAKGKCRRHYERTRHRHREDKLLVNRARGRALTRLRQRYPKIYQQYYDEELAIVLDEDRRIEAATGRERTRLLSGPHPADDDVTARVDTERLVIKCKTCLNYHARGHRCPTCDVINREDIPHAGFGN